MRYSSAAKLLVVLVVAVLVNAPVASASCPTPGCTVGGGGGCTQFIANPMLVHGCGWNKPSTAGYVDLTGISNLSSDAFVIPYNDPGDLETTYEFEVLPGSNPGTERLRVELVSSTFTISLGNFGASSTGGQISLAITDERCKGVPCLLRFRRTAGLAPGDTTFRIQYGFLFSVQ